MAPAKKKAAAKKAPARRRPRPRRLRPRRRPRQEGSGPQEGRSQEGSGTKKAAAKKAPAKRKKAAAKKAPAKQEGRRQEGSGQEEGRRPRRLRPTQEGSGQAGSGPQGHQEALTGSPAGAGVPPAPRGAGPTSSGHPHSVRRPAAWRSVASEAVRLVTWNVNSLKARQERVEEWLAECQPDVVCMQETKLADTAFPTMAFSALGYESAHHGEGRWNGVAILSRVGLDDVVAGFGDGGRPDAEARLVTATCGGVRVMSVYVPERARPRPRPLPVQAAAGSSGCVGHLDAVGRSRRRRSRCAATSTSRPTDARRVGHRGARRRHPRERRRSARPSQRLLDWGLTDVFRDQLPGRRAALLVVGLPGRQLPQGHRHAHRPRARLGAAAPSACEWALIDRNARKGKQPSDHAPLVVELADAMRERPRADAADATPGSPGWAGAHPASCARLEPSPRRAALFRVADAIRGVLHAHGADERARSR